MQIGFIGLGNMGAPIARNLLRAGGALAVYNRSAARAAPLVEAGARLAASPADAARGADVVLTMLADDAAVEAVTAGADGLLAALPAGAIHVSMSTISVALSERLLRDHEARGQGYVAAPVFGRPDAAAAAKLWVVAAGLPEAIGRCLPLFSSIGQGTHRVGEHAPQANLVKLSGNFLIASLIEVLGEAFALVRKGGVAAADLHAVLSSLVGGAPVLARYVSMVAEGAYEPAGFQLRLGLKDVRLVQQAAEASAVPMPVAGVLRDSFLQAIAAGLGDADWGAIALGSAARAGLEGGWGRT